MLPKTTWVNWNNNYKQTFKTNFLMSCDICKVITSLPWIRFLTPSWSGYWDVSLHFSKTSPKCGDAYSKSTFFVYPPERGEIGQSLPRLAHFHLKTSLDRWQLIKWCFTSSLHSDSRTKPLKPHDEPKFFPSLLFKKQSWDIMNISLANDVFQYFVYSIRFQFPRQRRSLL